MYRELSYGNSLSTDSSVFGYLAIYQGAGKTKLSSSVHTGHVLCPEVKFTSACRPGHRAGGAPLLSNAATNGLVAFNKSGV